MGPSASLDIFCYFRYKFCFGDRFSLHYWWRVSYEYKVYKLGSRLSMLRAYLPNANAVAPNIRV
jgi:hypothetical protein